MSLAEAMRRGFAARPGTRYQPELANTADDNDADDDADTEYIPPPPHKRPRSSTPNRSGTSDEPQDPLVHAFARQQLFNQDISSACKEAVEFLKAREPIEDTNHKRYVGHIARVIQSGMLMIPESRFDAFLLEQMALMVRFKSAIQTEDEFLIPGQNDQVHSISRIAHVVPAQNLQQNIQQDQLAQYHEEVQEEEPNPMEDDGQGMSHQYEQ